MPLYSSTNCSYFLWFLAFILFPLTLLSTLTFTTTLIEWDLTFFTSTPLLFYFICDPQGLLLSTAVLFISANILQFATFYMQDELFLSRFTHLVMLFVLSMNMLIYFPHMIFLLLGWDGLGLTSFLLVIYYSSPKSLAAGMLTALTNRVGDVFILMVIGWTLMSGQWNIMNIWSTSLTPWLIMFICLAAMTKSAQIPFSSWLPAAMAAPTPVSALVHSSTLVTAGVFLLIRFYNYLSSIYLFNMFLLLMSTLTMVMAGLAAMVECDLKKIIALSTLSQLGVMMMSISLGLPLLALFHLITHALFKASLFVCAGTLIHMNNHTQDLRQVGQILSQLPLTSAAFFISNIALTALPFMAGFYSKDLILETMSYTKINVFIMLLAGLATALTAAYSMRFLLMAWMSMFMHQPLHSINNNDLNSMTPSYMLSLGAIMGGSILNWMMIMPNLEPFLTFTSKLMPFMLTILGFITPLMMNMTQITMIKLKLPLHSLAYMWFLTPLSTQMMLSLPLSISLKITKLLDHGWNEYLGGQGMLTHLKYMSNTSNMLQPNMPTIHLTSAFLFIMLTMTTIF